MLPSLEDTYYRFRDPCFGCLQGRRFYLEDGSSGFHLNIGTCLSNHHIPEDYSLNVVLWFYSGAWIS
jgi:hypothetical protein